MSRTIEISDETFEKLKDQLTAEEQTDVSSLEDFVGKKLFIRTVTYALLGEVKAKIGNLLELKNASWVADTGRFSQFIKKGEISTNAEIEPVGSVYVNVQSVVDMYIWKFELPKE
jgi:hypothetical protein